MLIRVIYNKKGCCKSFNLRTRQKFYSTTVDLILNNRLIKVLDYYHTGVLYVKHVKNLEVSENSEYFTFLAKVTHFIEPFPFPYTRTLNQYVVAKLIQEPHIFANDGLSSVSFDDRVNLLEDACCIFAKKPTEEEENRRSFGRFLSGALVPRDTIITFKENPKRYLFISRVNVFKVIVELVFSPSEEDPIGTQYYALLRFEKCISEDLYVYDADLLEEIS